MQKTIGGYTMNFFDKFLVFLGIRSALGKIDEANRQREAEEELRRQQEWEEWEHQDYINELEDRIDEIRDRIDDLEYENAMRGHDYYQDEIDELNDELDDLESDLDDAYDDY